MLWCEPGRCPSNGRNTRRIDMTEITELRVALTVAGTGWAHALGVTSLLAFVTCGYRALLGDLLQPRPGSRLGDE